MRVQVWTERDARRFSDAFRVMVALHFKLAAAGYFDPRRAKRRRKKRVRVVHEVLGPAK